MKLGYFILFVLLIAVVSCNNVNDNSVTGKWGIIEFKMIQGGNEVMSSTAKNLTDAGAVWDMNFYRNGTFEQNFNMRNPEMKMETEKGSWTVSGDSIKIVLLSDTLTTKMNYKYKISNDTLNLSLTHPISKSSVVTKFTKK